MEAKTMEKRGRRRPSLRCGAFLFDVAVRAVDGVDVLAIEAKREDEGVNGTTFRTAMRPDAIATITEHICTNAAHLDDALRCAFNGTDGWSAGVRAVDPHADVSVNASRCLCVDVRYAFAFRKGGFTVSLSPIDATVVDRIDALARAVPGRSSDVFSERPDHCHPDLVVFHRGLAVVKARNGSDDDSGASVTTGASYDSGRHYIECRVIRCARDAYFMLGVQEGPVADGSGYPGDEAHRTGKGLHGDGTLHAGREDTDYGLGEFGPGDYVGVLLDMDAKSVAFSVNGRQGRAMSLSGGAYHIVANLEGLGSAAELVPEFCWHEYPLSA